MVGLAAPTEREALSGLVERLTYHNADNGFCVLQVKARVETQSAHQVIVAAKVMAARKFLASLS